jgi:hypothetical protein
MLIKMTDMIAWEETLAQEQHHNELQLLKTADHQRSIRREPKQETAFHQLLLARLGERLVRWGCRLQARYGTLAEATRSIRHVIVLGQQFSAPDAGAGLSLCLDSRR